MSPRESYALATYGMYLRIVEHMMGHSSTSSEQELRDAGKALFASKFDDVYAFDEFFYQTMYTQKTPKYCIINTDIRAEGGEHWFAWADGHIYDSFGREALGDTSGDAEQNIQEKNCGQRCLAWLLVYDTLGSDHALLI